MAVYIAHGTINIQGVIPMAVYVVYSTIYLSYCSFSKFMQVLFHTNYELNDVFSLSNHIYIVNLFRGFDTFFNKRQHIYLQAQLVDEKPVLAVFTFFHLTCLLAECLSVVSHISSLDRSVKYFSEFLWQFWSSIYLLYNIRLWVIQPTCYAFFYEHSVVEAQLIVCLNNHCMEQKLHTQAMWAQNQYKFAQNISDYWNKSRTESQWVSMKPSLPHLEDCMCNMRLCHVMWNALVETTFKTDLRIWECCSITVCWKFGEIKVVIKKIHHRMKNSLHHENLMLFSLEIPLNVEE